MDCSPPGSSLYGILQAKILEWVAIPFSRGSSRPRDQTWISCIDRWTLYHWAIRETPENINRYSLLIQRQRGICWRSGKPKFTSVPDRKNPKDTENNKGSMCIWRVSGTKLSTGPTHNIRINTNKLHSARNKYRSYKPGPQENRV